MKNKIVTIGEILWDSMARGLFPGGAPYNVAYHLARLGENTVLISRVGNDHLGREAVKRARQSGILTEFIQKDAELPTGFVEVEVRDHGIPDYDIKKPAAWDEIRLTEAVKNEILSADAVVFGTLAQRSLTSRNTIQWIQSFGGLKVLDLNLRSPYDDREVVEQSLGIADFVKMNDEELEKIRDWYNLPEKPEQAVAELAGIFGLQTICITCGSQGAWLWKEGDFTKSSGYDVEVADTVGSGDAFLAVMVAGYLKQIPSQDLLDLSNRLGAFVASQEGGMPAYSIDSILDIHTLPLHLEKDNV